MIERSAPLGDLGATVEDVDIAPPPPTPLLEDPAHDASVWLNSCRAVEKTAAGDMSGATLIVPRRKPEALLRIAWM